MIIGVFGKPRSGKTTFLAKKLYSVLLARKFAESRFVVFRWFGKRSKNYYDYVYSTSPMLGTLLIDPYDIGRVEPLQGKRTLYIIHEAGVCFNNRNSRSVPDWCTNFFALHGHYNTDIIYDSQTVDIDKKLRNRTQCFYVVTKCPIRRGRSRVSRVKYWIGVNQQAQKLDECYTEPMGFWQWFLAVVTRQRYTFRRRKYYKLFDSYSRELDFTKQECRIMPNNPLLRKRQLRSVQKKIKLFLKNLLTN